jgi:hypothetical protein
LKARNISAVLVNKQLFKLVIAFGGKVGNGKLWIDGDMPENCHLLPEDDTYEIGQIITGKELNVIDCKF